MEKNDYLLINDIIYRLYTEEDLHQVKLTLLNRLRQLIPYSYASIIMCKPGPDHVILSDPVCYPASFQKAEEAYMRLNDTDRLDWILYSQESELVRESELIDDRNRLVSPIYRSCYRSYDIYDSLQMSIVYEKKIYAVLTLYRTKSDGLFRDEEMFYLRSLSRHLNYLFHSHLDGDTAAPNAAHMKELAGTYRLTRRESEILGYIKECLSNDEILERIPITAHTLQKHLQNIYNKCDVSTRWDLLKL